MAVKSYYRRVIKIRGEDSPNVRFAMAQIRAGKKPTGEMLVPGVLPYADYMKRRRLWDAVRQCIGLDAEFWEGADVLMYPPEWLNVAAQLAERLRGTTRKTKAIGIDPAEGGDFTSMSAVDEFGLVEQVSKRTPNTDVVPKEAFAFMQRHSVDPANVVFDRGGGGKQHADRMRASGFLVRTVAFGEGVVLEPRRGLRPMDEKWDQREEHYAYVNRRAQMYGELRELMDPHIGSGFAIPEYYTKLRQQMASIPMMYDKEGRLKLLPKHKNTPESTEKTLIDLIGHSPDELDSLVLAVHGLLHKGKQMEAGAI